MPLLEGVIQERSSNLFDTEIYNQAVRHPSNAERELVLQARKYKTAQDWQKAIDSYIELVRLFPRPESYLLLGYAYHQFGNSQRAVSIFEKATKLFPNNSDTHFYLGLFYLKLGKWNKAMNALLKKIKLSPNDGEAYLFLGYTQYNMKHWPQAIDAFQKAIRIDKKNVSAYLALAVLYTDLGLRDDGKQEAFFQKAMKACEKLVENNRLSSEEQNKLGKVYFLLRELEEAEKAFTKVLKLDPDNPEALNNLRLVKEDQLAQRLYELGFLKRINKRLTDFSKYQKRKPIKVKGKPISETIVEDRR
jgi:tetratricopeptide (TPR) repeat protein